MALTGLITAVGNSVFDFIRRSEDSEEAFLSYVHAIRWRLGFPEL